MLIVPLWSWSGRFLKRAAQRRGTKATEEARIQLREAAEGDERKWLDWSAASTIWVPSAC